MSEGMSTIEKYNKGTLTYAELFKSIGANTMIFSDKYDNPILIHKDNIQNIDDTLPGPFKTGTIKLKHGTKIKHGIYFREANGYPIIITHSTEFTWRHWGS